MSNPGAMKNITLFIAINMLNICVLFSQGVAINTDGSAPDNSAILDVCSTMQGFLPPRLTRLQILFIDNPADGLMVYNTTDSKLYIYRSVDGAWKEVDLGTQSLTPFVCGNNWYDPRDGKTYATVLINDRCWFAGNLNVGVRVNASAGQGNNQIIEKVCYNDVESNCTTLGGLYNWDEAMNYVTTPGNQGICPDGWYIPTDADWYNMENYLDNTINDNTIFGYRGTDCGGKLKETGTAYWNSPNVGATNSSGFSARGGGREIYIPYGGHVFMDYHVYGFFWTSNTGGSYSPPMWSGPICRYLHYNSQQSGRGYDDWMFGNESSYSVRCILNE